MLIIKFSEKALAHVFGGASSVSGRHQRLDLPKCGTVRCCLLIWCSKYVPRYGELAFPVKLNKKQ